MFKLFIYDAADEGNREQAEERFDGDASVIQVPFTSENDLTASLKGLVALNYSFDRVLVQTHGGPGYLEIGQSGSKNALTPDYFSTTLSRIGIAALFPRYTRIYFDGCEVAAGEGGTNFLTAVGEVLLKTGGEVYGWTSPGYAFPSWFTGPFVPPGETIHFSGMVKRAYFVQGRRINIVEH